MGNLRSTPLPFLIKVIDRNRLSGSAFELILEKPAGFDFRPGQKVMLAIDTYSREYSLASAPEEKTLRFCIRQIEGGIMSNRLAILSPGQQLKMSAPYGFFIYRKGRAVLIATGTGVAPFVSYCRSGIRGFIMLHGVRGVEELYYRDILQRSAALYVPCVSGSDESGEVDDLYHGRVTQYLRHHLPVGEYTFYVCGNGEMIRDVIRSVDNLFPYAKIFTETFYH